MQWYTLRVARRLGSLRISTHLLRVFCIKTCSCFIVNANGMWRPLHRHCSRGNGAHIWCNGAHRSPVACTSSQAVVVWCLHIISQVCRKIARRYNRCRCSAIALPTVQWCTPMQWCNTLTHATSLSARIAFSTDRCVAMHSWLHCSHYRSFFNHRRRRRLATYAYAHMQTAEDRRLES